MGRLDDVALLTKTLYDITEFRISLANRMRQYGLADQPFQWWPDRLKEVKAMERDFQKELKDRLSKAGFDKFMDIKGIGPRVAGAIIMYVVKTERLHDEKGKYIGTRFYDEFMKFKGARSLFHYAGLIPICKYCGLTESQCVNEQSVIVRVGKEDKEFIGCGDYEAKAAKERRGKPVTWNPSFRKRLLSLASSLFRTGGPYADIYKRERAKAEESHPDWAKGARFNHAKKMMMRQLLKDFYFEYLKGEGEDEI